MKANIDVPDNIWSRFKVAAYLDNKTIKKALLEIIEIYIHEVNARNN